MTDSDDEGVCGGGATQQQVCARGEAALLADGWKRCFVADEPRLSEALETYEELGFEVTTAPVDVDGGGCTECMKSAPCQFQVIFTRKRG